MKALCHMVVKLRPTLKFLSTEDDNDDAAGLMTSSSDIRHGELKMDPVWGKLSALIVIITTYLFAYRIGESLHLLVHDVIFRLSAWTTSG